MQSRWDWERRANQSWPVKAWCSSDFFNASSAATVTFDAAGGDGVFAQDFAALDDTPARRLQRGINVLGPGFGIVHSLTLRFNRPLFVKRDAHPPDVVNKVRMREVGKNGNFKLVGQQQII
jgi:hypothetical protein